ncbi:hypothetical protein JCM6882_007374 [Rhodosporidiobolus microsporus]
MSASTVSPRLTSFDSPDRTIVVLGATGQQGSGAVLHLLARTSFRVVALTRSPSSSTSVALLEKHKAHVDSGRFRLEQADIEEDGSLEKAFEGAWGVFAVTQWKTPVQTEEDLKVELFGGKKIVDAAQTAGVSHLIYSGLPSPSAATSNQFQHIWHFEHKASVEQYALETLGSDRVTFVHAGMFLANFFWPTFSGKADDGVLEFRAPLGADTLQAWTDPAYDVGLFASELFLLGPSSTGGKTYPVHSSPLSLSSLSSLYTQQTGLPSRVNPSPVDGFAATIAAYQGPGLERDAGEMMRFFEWAGEPYAEGKADYGAMEKEEYEARVAELGGRVRASTFEEWLERSGFGASA